MKNRIEKIVKFLPTRRRVARAWSFAGAFVLLLSACSYHAGDSRSPESELKLFIPVIENRTARAFELNDLTGQLREMLAGVRGVQIVRSADESQSVILAKIVEFSKGWGPTVFKGSSETEAKGGLRDNFLSAQSVGITLGIEITKLNSAKEKLWTIVLSEKDFYQLTDRLELNRGSAAAPQIHASREALLVKKLSEKIFRRAKAQIVDDF
jgi:hypothetical protein